MPYSKSNAWLWLPVCVFPLAIISCSIASAQGTGGGGIGGGGGGIGGGGGGIGGGGGAIQPNSGGSDLIDMEAVFIGDVERENGVGQFSKPVGASVNSAAEGLTGGTGARPGSALGGLGGGLGGLGGLGAAFNNPLGTGAVGGEAVPPLRTRLRSAVELPAVGAYDSIARETKVNSRLQSIGTLGPRSPRNDMVGFSSSSRPLYGVSVQMEGRRAILEGTVDNASDRRMSELLIRLEPGVFEVDNRISVAE